MASSPTRTIGRTPPRLQLHKSAYWSLSLPHARKSAVGSRLVVRLETNARFRATPEVHVWKGAFGSIYAEESILQKKTAIRCGGWPWLIRCNDHLHRGDCRIGAALFPGFDMARQLPDKRRI